MNPESLEVDRGHALALQLGTLPFLLVLCLPLLLLPCSDSFVACNRLSKLTFLYATGSSQYITGVRASRSSGDMLALHPNKSFPAAPVLASLLPFLVRPLRGLHPSLLTEFHVPWDIFIHAS